jgi:hypothetical protein
LPSIYDLQEKGLVTHSFLKHFASAFSGEVGCRCVITDAYRDRMSWYARYGFIPIEGAAAEGPQRMFLDIRTIRKARQSRS